MSGMSRPFGVTDIKKLKDGKMLVTGRAMELDTPLLNGTVYSRKLWEKEVIPAYQVYIDNRMAYGMLDHPLRDFKDISTKLKNVYGRITKLFISDDGKFLMATILIYNNEVGKNLQYFLENGTVGVSTRGKGKTKESNGNRIVLKYNFIGLDFVAMPSSVKALYTATNGEDNWDELIEGVSFSTDEEMFDRMDLIEEVKKNKDLDVSSYFEFDDNINDKYICDLNGDCKLKSLMENKNSILDEDVLMENVADMLTPQVEIKLSTFKDDIKKLSREDLEKKLLAVELEQEANKYLKLPHGEFLRKVFIAMTQSMIDVKTIEQVLTLFNKELAVDSDAENTKIKALEAELSSVKEQLNSIKMEANKRIQSAINESQATIENIKKENKQKEDLLKQQHSEQVNLLKDTVASVKTQAVNDIKENQEKVSSLKNTIAVVKKDQAEKINNIKKDITKTEDVINQYYNLIEEKNEVINSYEAENIKLKNEYDGLLNEVGQISESYSELKSISESLVLEKGESVELYENLTHELKTFKDNVNLLENKIITIDNEKKTLLSERIELNNNLTQLQTNFEVVESKWTNKLNVLVNEKMEMAKEMENTLSFLQEYKKLLEHAEIKESNFIKQKEEFIVKAEEADSVISLMEDKFDKLEDGIVLLKTEKEAILEDSLRDKNLLSITNEELEAVKVELEDTINENDDLNDDLMEASNYIQTLKNKNKEIEDKNIELQKKMSILSSKMSKVKAKLMDSEKRKENSLKLKRKNEEINSKINIKQKNIEKKKDNLISIYESFDVEDEVDTRKEPTKKKKRSFRSAFKSSVIE